MELSKRLSAVAGLVTEGASVADIGTDHAYIPIYLAEHNKSSHIIAMDINRGPLEKAKEHIAEYGLESMIQTKLSDGLSGLLPNEVDTMIAAGMGGGLVIRILQNSPDVVESLHELVLQPQSEIHKVREYVNTHGFIVAAEDMVEEDGKYYPMMKLVHGTEEPFSEEELYYGRKLLQEKHPILREYLKREFTIKSEICEKLKKQESERTKKRVQEVELELKRIQHALGMMGESEVR